VVDLTGAVRVTSVSAADIGGSLPSGASSL
jgi:hypothetical protein